MTSGSGAVRTVQRDFGALAPRAMVLATVALALGAVVAAHVSDVAFVAIGAALLVLLGAATIRWPRAMLVALVLSPALIDLYAGQRLLPEDVQPIARLFSEGLLLVMTCVLVVRAARRRTLVGALRHPFSLAVAVFVALGLISSVLNGVSAPVAAAGLIFTLDAVVLFYLPRTVIFSHAQARRSLWAVAVAMGIASLMAVGQAVLSPDLLGVTPVTGVSGEGVRLGSLVRDPNILGTLIGMAIPLTMFSVVRLPRGRTRWLVAATALALTLALLLTYSRGSWLGVLVGFMGVALLVDRRALVVFIGVLLLAYATAVIMPKGLLGGGYVGYDAFATTINRLDDVGEGRDLRTLFIRNAIPIVEEHPLLGVGPGRYGGAAASLFGSPVHEQYGTDRLLTNQKTVDNFWLHLGVESGALGVAAFLAMIAIALMTPIRALRGGRGSRFAVPAGIVSATAVVAVAAVTTMLLEGNTAAFLFWFLLGIGSQGGSVESVPRTVAPAGSASPSAG